MAQDICGVKEVQVLRSISTSYPGRQKRTAQRDWKCLSPAISYITRPSSAMSSQGDPRQGQSLHFHMLAMVSNVLNKSQVSLPGLVPHSPSGSPRSQTRPCSASNVSIGEFQLHLPHDLELPCGRRNHWTPRMPLLTLA